MGLSLLSTASVKAIWSLRLLQALSSQQLSASGDPFFAAQRDFPVDFAARVYAIHTQSHALRNPAPQYASRLGGHAQLSAEQPTRCSLLELSRQPASHCSFLHSRGGCRQEALHCRAKISALGPVSWGVNLSCSTCWSDNFRQVTEHFSI